MRKLKVQLVWKSFQSFYFSLIRQLLEYADVVWNNCTQYESNELDKSKIRERSGSVFDSRLRGRGFEPHWRHFVVVLEQDTFILA